MARVRVGAPPVSEEQPVGRVSRRKPQSYIILAAPGIPELSLEVNEKLAAGWQPIGGPLKLGTDWGLAQAMIK